MRHHHQTTLVIATIVTAALSGCALPGKFSREQYAQLDSDPFLATGADTIAKTDTREAAGGRKSADMTTADAGTPGRFDYVNDEPSTPPPARETAAVPGREQRAALADLFDAPEGEDGTAAPRSIRQAAAVVGDDAFSQFMDGQKNKVVHASAEFVDMVEDSQQAVVNRVQDSGAWGFPSDVADPSQTGGGRAADVGDRNPFADEMAAPETNPFAAQASTPEVAPPADVFGSAKEDSAWPPGNFEPN